MIITENVRIPTKEKTERVYPNDVELNEFVVYNNSKSNINNSYDAFKY